MTTESIAREPGSAASRPALRLVTEPSWPRRIGLMNDYLRVPWANGSSFAGQFFYRRFSELGHEVTLIGPGEPDLRREDLPPRHIVFPALPLRCSGYADGGARQVGLWLAFPGRKAIRQAVEARFDVVVGQCANELINLGHWLRVLHGIPFVSVNTLHFASTYNALLPNVLLRNERLNGWFRDTLIPWLEHHTAMVHNETDGLVVLAEGLADFWRARGVTVPIHVVPRAVEPRVFDAPIGPDPFPAGAPPGRRLLCVCRHAREKEVARLIEVFARYVRPACPDATLTLVGDGPEHEEFIALAERLGVADHVFFPGERHQRELPDWYRHADVFVYASLSETYGQVVGEAAWCGLPIVAFADGMGVSSQLADGETGYLVDPGPDEALANRQFAREAVALLRHPNKREVLGRAAAARARARCSPEAVIARYRDVFEDARRHHRETIGAVRRPRLTAAKILARWALVQSLAVVLGALRPPPRVNRRGVKPPHWNDLAAPPAGEGEGASSAANAE